MSDENKKPVVLITHPGVPKCAIELLSITCQVISCENVPPKYSEILEKCINVDGILLGDNTFIDVDVLDAAGANLKAISALTTRVDQVDIAEISKRGIKMGNAPSNLCSSVAELAIGLLITAMRRFYEGELIIEHSKILIDDFQWMLGYNIRGATAGIFGFGNTGACIATLLKGFDINNMIYADDIESTQAIKFKAVRVSFDELLEKSDFIFIACPLTSRNQNIFNANTFKKMKSHCVLVNTASAGIVNQKDLYDALKNKTIFAAGLDVCQPIPADDPLLKLPNLIITPHIGTATKKTRDEIAIVAAYNLLDVFAGLPMRSQIV